MQSILVLLPSLLQGAVVTIEITLISAVLSFFMAFIAGFGRLSKFFIIRMIASIYIEVFRGTSLLVQLFWLYFALPMFGLQLPPMVAGIIALVLNYGAYGAEVVRSAILAVPKGQTEASIALNLSNWQRMRLVILPQALLIMLPTFGNNLIELLKSTSLVSLVTIADLTFKGIELQTTTLQSTTIFSLLLILYFVIAYPLSLGVRWIERRVSVGRM
ncbi:ectoine/hydroxyectoine ABC transporter permease subunit EhuC [Fodinisporobacter ferrooxydans]|uniref:Ectoine/hydroxyectoine ABC transporter permease subunit EhuC n=1 Tax=Fodinisporobacter ferrooxydans TaxID=2901836 RepID=A0ABY4CM80_9BACL|nr:ectoine/hydroxyectoine ABC transporter permease subunit EhuC [Alicyclobacillaceae bacterium MYW30-H2]